MKVSVILPVFNARRTICEAVASVLEQSHGELELIVIDDGSTDGSAAALVDFDDPRLRVHTCPRAGSAASRNRGLLLATAPYVACIDADDVWLPDKLSLQLDALRTDREAAVAYGWADFVDAEGRTVCSDGRPMFHGSVHEPLLLQNFIVSGSNTLMRRSALESVGGYDESLQAVEDWDLNLRLAATHPFVCVPQVVLRYRLTPGSLSSQLELMESCYLRVLERELQAAPAETRRLRPRSVAAFYTYLATRATQGGLAPHRWLAAARLYGIALRADPREALSRWNPTSIAATATLSVRALRNRRPVS